MTLRQAEALSPAVAVVEPRPEAAHRFRDRIAAALYDVAPVIEVRLDGCAMCASFAPTCRCMGAREFITALPKVGGARLTSARLD